jgi:uncharacterized HhH-GPD family protein
MPTTPVIPITGDESADLLLEESPLALLLGMLLDQQVPMEWAFRGPATLNERLGSLDANEIASLGQEEFVAVCADKPAIHRFPASMGRRIHDVCTVVADEYDGQAERIWTEASDAKDLERRLRALPGYGAEKTKIFVAILAKRFDVKLDGWEKVAAPFSDDQPRSVADVHSEESLMAVRSWKKAMKAAKKSKADQP